MRLILKIILVFSILLVLLVSLTQFPPVQKYVGLKISNSLTEKTGGEVKIGSISVSLAGKVNIYKISISDPDTTRFFSSDNITADINLLKLLKKEIYLDKVIVENLEATLLKNDSVLNIQYFIDAFNGNKISDPGDTVKNNFKLGVNEISFSGISFHLITDDSTRFLDARIGEFNSRDFNITINPNTISLSEASLTNSGCKIRFLNSEGELTEGSIDSMALPYFDFYSGFQFNIGSVDLHDNFFSLHVDDYTDSAHFDAQQLDIDNIDIRLEDLLMRKDSFALRLDHLSATMPRFSNLNVSTNIKAGLNHLNISEFQIRTPNSHIEIHAQSKYDHWHQFLKTMDQTPITLSMVGEIDPVDITYFLSDSLLRPIENWNRLYLDLDASTIGRKWVVNNGEVRSNDGSLRLSGEFRHFLHPDKMQWENLKIQLVVGTKFNQLLSKSITQINIPPQIVVDVESNGRLNNFNSSVLINTNWGLLKSAGTYHIFGDQKGFNTNLISQQLDVGKFISQPWFGPTEFVFQTDARWHNSVDLQYHGNIHSIALLNQPVDSISIKGSLKDKVLNMYLEIKDPSYPANVNSSTTLTDTLLTDASIELKEFNLARLLGSGNDFKISGKLKTKIGNIDEHVFGMLALDELSMDRVISQYQIDTLDFSFLSSQDTTNFLLSSKDFSGNYVSNFPLIEIPKTLSQYFSRYINADLYPESRSQERVFKMALEIDNEEPFQFVYPKLDNISGLTMTGEFNEKNESLDLMIASNEFDDHGLELDSILFIMDGDPEDVSAKIQINNIIYDSLELGRFYFDLITKNDSAKSLLSLSKDSLSILSLQTSLIREKREILLLLDSLIANNIPFYIDQSKPIRFGKNKLEISKLALDQDSLGITIQNSSRQLGVSIKNLGLTNIDHFLAGDTSMINNGHFNADLAYDRVNNDLKVLAQIEDLVIYEAPPVQISANARTVDDKLPFDVQFQSLENRIIANGNIAMDSTNYIDADLTLDVENLNEFEFLFPEKIDELSGELKGHTRIHGPLTNPFFDGFLALSNAKLITKNPRTSLYIPNDKLTFNQNGASFKNFKVLDDRNNPLILNGYINSDDYQSFEYDLNLSSDYFFLIDNPRKEPFLLQGILVIGSEVEISGNSKDLNRRRNRSASGDGSTPPPSRQGRCPWPVPAAAGSGPR